MAGYITFSIFKGYADEKKRVKNFGTLFASVYSSYQAAKSRLSHAYRFRVENTSCGGTISGTEKTSFSGVLIIYEKGNPCNHEAVYQYKQLKKYMTTLPDSLKDISLE